MYSRHIMEKWICIIFVFYVAERTKNESVGSDLMFVSNRAGCCRNAQKRIRSAALFSFHFGHMTHKGLKWHFARESLKQKRL